MEQERQEREAQQEQSPEQNQQQQQQPDVWNKDLNETGRWGSRSRKELLVVAGVSLLIVAATVVGVIVGTKDARMGGGDKNNNGGKSKIDPVTGQRVSTYQFPTPPAPTIVTDQQEWDAVREKLSLNSALSTYLTAIPQSIADIAATGANAADPYLKAAHWLTAVDTVNELEWAPIRFALASIYYTTTGTGWTNQTNWLSTTNHCQWHGIYCCDRMQASLLCSVTDFYNVVEIDLYGNNLVGPIPNTFGLFPDLQSLFLSENALTGSVNGDVFLGLQYFTKLYLQHNKLTGSIPVNLDPNKKLGTFHVLSPRSTVDADRYPNDAPFPQIHCIFKATQ
jgi:Leucine rich repeat